MPRVTCWLAVCQDPLHPNRNFREFVVNGKITILCQCQFMRIFLENNKYFSIYFVFFFSRLTLNSSAVQLPFTTDVQKKASCIFSHIFLLPPRSVPHNNYAHSSNRTFNSLWHHLGWGANRAYGKAGIRNPGPEPETEPEPEPEPELKLRPG